MKDDDEVTTNAKDQIGVYNVGLTSVSNTKYGSDIPFELAEA